MKRLNVMLDDDLHRKLKLTAFDQGITMSDFVKRLLEKTLEGEERQQELKKEG